MRPAGEPDFGRERRRADNGKLKIRVGEVRGRKRGRRGYIFFNQRPAQQIDGNIIGPKIVGDSIGLSSFWVLFSILVFSGIFGVTGMLIGVPVFAIIYDIIKKTVVYFEKKKSLILLNENNKTNCKITIKKETE